MRVPDEVVEVVPGHKGDYGDSSLLETCHCLLEIIGNSNNFKLFFYCTVRTEQPCSNITLQEFTYSSIFRNVFIVLLGSVLKINLLL